ncbi:LysR family transcriptional regulator [Pseudomonas sp. MM211]|uniref:LysR family transcriptional regulator n=1 Tax=Pseudomonas sp. MM211 TaxID=2866808 RepID=UPI003FA69196
MMQDELGSLAAFVAVAQLNSFTRAAGRLGTSQSALSHKIRRLEGRLGIRLLSRTTRSVAPTEAGARLLETLGPALEDIHRQLGALTGAADQPAGTVRITSADHAAETIVWPAVHTLLSDYPDLNIELDVDNGFVDIVAERYDAGIRLGANLDKDMVAVPIGPPEQLVVVGAPSYFATYPKPETPFELSSHRCINRRLPTLGGASTWEFARDGQPLKVRVSGQLSLNRPELIIQAAMSGLGLACLLRSQVEAQIRAGSLLPILQQWCPSFAGYHLYYPSRRQNTAAFQLLVAALRYHEN